MAEILIKNIRIPSLADRKTQSCDILFSLPASNKRGKILEIAPRIQYENAITVEGKGDYILPAFIDLCADIHHPAEPERENITSGSLAALRGGYSDILIKDKGEDIDDAFSHCNIHVCNKNNNGNSPLIYAEALDCRALRELFTENTENDPLIFLSPKPDPLYPNSCITNCRTADMLALPCEPPSVEARSVFEYLVLAEETGRKIHIRGISCAKSVELIRRAKADGVRVSASTSPIYFSLKADDIFFIGPNSKVYPPLREEFDRKALIEGIEDGTIDCIDSGHTPVTREKKCGNIIDCAYGAIGLQSCFPATVTYLLLPGHIDIYRLCELMYYNPGKILGLDVSPSLSKNSAAFNLASVSNEFIFSESYIKGQSVNSPFLNMSLCGNIRETYIL